MQSPTGALPTLAEIAYAPPEALASAPPGTWFFGSPPQVQGPVPHETLKNLLRAGRLPPTTPVWAQGMVAFAPASAIPGLLPSSEDVALGLIVPTGPQSAKAIIAGYCGLFGIIIWLLGPFGLIVGFLALGDLKANPHKKGHGRAWTGIVLGGLETLLLAYFILRGVL
jgi:hypothetical protein